METASAWVLTGELPSPRKSLRGANIDNKILMTGNIADELLKTNIYFSNYKGLLICNKSLGGNTGSDEILEFSPVTEQWKLVDRMIQARKAHAVSVINFQSGLCV